MNRPQTAAPLLFDLPQAPDFSIEKRLIARGKGPVCGLDEAGRGPLAGPVVAAAVILDPKRIPKGLDDSKRLKPCDRERLFEEIVRKAVAVSVASVAADGIDTINILRASLEAMRRAAATLCVTPRHALVDGRDIPPGLGCDADALIKGDQRSQSIAAASIVAKVTRDRMMTRCAAVHPSYGFEFHMGYATVRHRTAIVESGAVMRIHRMTFAPLKADAEPMALEFE
ncbi:ribonuclease HII [Aquibium oceanicum]|uniref:Ribonuclease HII n=1 Tax=Aquibium oceanicum TaxID=1670800 RepID=A0A1L3SP21_9HYPH|nr:ribonuclease HII [Aquibium oceanicum]APH71159.1 ribonuclease HII [Aquibium oceanicum]